MPWFVVSRPIPSRSEARGEIEYRVCSEEEIEDIGPEWEWASSACDSEEEARQLADDLFWDDSD